MPEGGEQVKAHHGAVTRLRLLAHRVALDPVREKFAHREARRRERHAVDPQPRLVSLGFRARRKRLPSLAFLTVHAADVDLAHPPLAALEHCHDGPSPRAGPAPPFAAHAIKSCLLNRMRRPTRTAGRRFLRTSSMTRLLGTR